MNRSYSVQVIIVFSVVKINDPHITKYRIYKESTPLSEANVYLRFMETKDLAANTVRANAYDLVRFFKYIQSRDLIWLNVVENNLVNYIFYLRHHKNSDVSVLPVSNQQVRSDRTVSRMMSSVLGFYRYYHFHQGLCFQFDQALIEKKGFSGSEFMSFARNARPLSVKRATRGLTRYRTQKVVPKIFDQIEVKNMIGFCANNRDRLLISLLIHSGIRIGQALNLRHSDLDSVNLSVHIIPRRNNENDSFVKSRNGYSVQVKRDWFEEYTDYLVFDIEDLNTDYVFTKLYRNDNGDRTEPMRYSTVKKLMSALSRKTGLEISAHKFRHTYATWLLQKGVSIDLVAKQLGHKSSETTRQIYEHLSPSDLRKGLKLE